MSLPYNETAMRTHRLVQVLSTQPWARYGNQSSIVYETVSVLRSEWDRAGPRRGRLGTHSGTTYVDTLMPPELTDDGSMIRYTNVFAGKMTQVTASEVVAISLPQYTSNSGATVQHPGRAITLGVKVSIDFFITADVSEIEIEGPPWRNLQTDQYFNAYASASTIQIMEDKVEQIHGLLYSRSRYTAPKTSLFFIS